MLSDLQKAKEDMRETVTDFSNFSLSIFLQTGWRKKTRLEVCLAQVTVVVISLTAEVIQKSWLKIFSLLNDLSSISDCDCLSGGYQTLYLIFSGFLMTGFQ